jgi:hypothetical protein
MNKRQGIRLIGRRLIAEDILPRDIEFAMKGQKMCGTQMGTCLITEVMADSVGTSIVNNNFVSAFGVNFEAIAFEIPKCILPLDGWFTHAVTGSR